MTLYDDDDWFVDMLFDGFRYGVNNVYRINNFGPLVLLSYITPTKPGLNDSDN